jgi:hypothetical protein
MSDIVNRPESEMAQPEGDRQALGAKAGNSAARYTWLAELSAYSASAWVTETAPGYAAYTAKQIDPSQEGSAIGLVAAVMPRTDAQMVKMLRDPATPAFALPLAKWSGSKTIDRELTELYKRDPKQLRSEAVLEPL